MYARSHLSIKIFLFCMICLFAADQLYGAGNTRFSIKNGIIYDSKLGVEWIAANDTAMNHYQAEKYAKSLELAGRGWRLPTLAELKSLRDQSKPEGIDPIFHIGQYHLVWSSEMDGDVAGYFIFGNGTEGGAARDTDLHYIRVLVVRSR